MPALTPDERRGGLLVVVLLLVGAAWDTWRAVSVPAPVRVSAPVQSATRFDSVAESGEQSAPGAPRDTSLRLDLNRADVQDLDRLPGIGPVLAARIVEHRARHGGFRSVDELRAVRGVGPRLIEKLRPQVRAGP